MDSFDFQRVIGGRATGPGALEELAPEDTSSGSVAEKLEEAGGSYAFLAENHSLNGALELDCYRGKERPAWHSDPTNSFHPRPTTPPPTKASREAAAYVAKLLADFCCARREQVEVREGKSSRTGGRHDDGTMEHQLFLAGPRGTEEFASGVNDCCRASSCSHAS